MPALIPLAIGLAATIGAYALLPAVVVIGSLKLGAAFLAGIIGTIVSTAASFLMSSLMKPKAPAAPRAEDRKQSVRSSIEPRRVIYGNARVGGAMVYVASAGLDLEDLHIVVVLAGHRCHAVQQVWINDVVVPTSALGSDGEITDTKHKLYQYANIRVYLGTQTAADSVLMAAFPDVWTADHLLTGCTYLAIRLRYNRDKYASGLQNISAEVSGKDDIADPRTSTTGYTNNWALCVNDYLRGGYGLACAADEVDTATIIAAANLSDEQVALNPGGTVTEPRYRVDGAFTLDQAPIEIMEGLLSAGAGTIVYVQGQYRLYGGAYSAPTLSLMPSDFAGDIRLETRPPRRDVFNAVRGTFVDPERNWQASEFPPLLFPAFEAADGERIFRDMSLAFTIGSSPAQRLARVAALTARDSVSFTAPMRYAALRLACWQMVSVTHPDFGWVNKPFRVHAWRFDPASGEVTVSFREENAANYAWTSELASQVPPHPRTTLVDPLNIPAPAGIEANEELYATRDGAGVRTRILLTWGKAPSAFVTGYEVQFRPFLAGDWIDAGGGDTTRHEIDDVAAGNYEFRVRSTTLLGRSDWNSTARFVGGLAALPPVAVDALTIQAIGGTAFLRWARHPDLDVRVGGRFEVRHTPTTGSGAVWGIATTLGDAIPGDSTFALLPLKAGTYLIKPVDAGGVYAATAASVTASQATALAFANVTTVTENAAFSGTKTSTTVAASKLKLSTGADVGSYAFAAGIDLTTVRSVRLTSRILAAIINEAALWDARTDLIDTWSSVDDIVIGGEADAWVEARQTDDDPSGTPTWGPWMRMDASEFRARAFQFRAQLRRYDAVYNIEIAELSVSADEVA